MDCLRPLIAALPSTAVLRRQTFLGGAQANVVSLIDLLLDQVLDYFLLLLRRRILAHVPTENDIRSRMLATYGISLLLLKLLDHWQASAHLRPHGRLRPLEFIVREPAVKPLE